MKIGIMVHSYTGHTLSVAQKLKVRLAEKGHEAVLGRIAAVNEDPSSRSAVVLENNPDTNGYDALVFAAPVRGFSLSPVLKEYLDRISSLNGKKVSCLVTEAFPFACMGGNQAISLMCDICRSKNAKITETAVVNWSGGKREKKIGNAVEKLSRF